MLWKDIYAETLHVVLSCQPHGVCVTLVRFDLFGLGLHSLTNRHPVTHIAADCQTRLLAIIRLCKRKTTTFIHENECNLTLEKYWWIYKAVFQGCQSKHTQKCLLRRIKLCNCYKFVQPCTASLSDVFVCRDWATGQYEQRKQEQIKLLISRLNLGNRFRKL